MKVEVHNVNNTLVAEVISSGVIIRDASDGSDIMGELYFAGSDRIIIHEKNLAAAFFDLKTGIAGEILQKFSNYRMRLAIVGDFGKYESESLKAFISESNRGKEVNFVASRDEAIMTLTY